MFHKGIIDVKLREMWKQVMRRQCFVFRELKIRSPYTIVYIPGHNTYELADKLESILTIVSTIYMELRPFQ